MCSMYPFQSIFTFAVVLLRAEWNKLLIIMVNFFSYFLLNFSHSYSYSCRWWCPKHALSSKVSRTIGSFKWLIISFLTWRFGISWINMFNLTNMSMLTLVSSSWRKEFMLLYQFTNLPRICKTSYLMELCSWQCALFWWSCTIRNSAIQNQLAAVCLCITLRNSPSLSGAL